MESLYSFLTDLLPFLAIVGVATYSLMLGVKSYLPARFAKLIPSIPVLLGAVLGMAFKSLLPEAYGTHSLASGIGFGIVAGSLSSKIYEQVIRFLERPLPAATADVPAAGTPDKKDETK